MMTETKFKVGDRVTRIVCEGDVPMTIRGTWNGLCWVSAMTGATQVYPACELQLSPHDPAEVLAKLERLVRSDGLVHLTGRIGGIPGRFRVVVKGVCWGECDTLEEAIMAAEKS